MKALVTGPRGFVGARIMDELKDAIPSPSLRNADRDTILRSVEETHLEVIIHTAAISDTPTCEKNPEASCRTNVEIPIWLAQTGVKCIFFSTDQVYSGCDSAGPYTENTVCPSNLYSRHNLWMVCSKIKAHGICFNNTIDGLRQCI